MPRNLVSLIDGTMVCASQTSSAKAYSNVFELACLLQLKQTSSDGSPQIVFYTSGISSQPDTRSALNLATGKTIRSQIVDQYTNICANYEFEPEKGEEPDRIFLFGFSRGAMAVRAVASIIAEFGLLHPKDIRFLPLILDAWHKSLGAGSLPDHITRRGAEIDFIGLFDPVMGGIERLRMFNPVRFRNSQLPAKCKHGVQILAIDENRRYFKPKRWEGVHPGRTADGSPGPDRDLKQIWMPGVHSDVGGTGNQVWGRAALLAMIHYIDKWTGLELDRKWIREKERNLCEGVDHQKLIINPRRLLFMGHQRQPSSRSDWNERRHPICDRVDTLTFSGDTAYCWRERVYERYFRRLDVDDDLAEYFHHVLNLNGGDLGPGAEPSSARQQPSNVHKIV